MVLTSPTVLGVGSNLTFLYGQSETFTATITVLNGSPPPSEGTVTFFDDGAPLGTAPVSSGVATFTTSGLAVGLHPITASYSGTANYEASAWTGSESIVANSGLGNPSGVTVDGAGDVFIADSTKNRVIEVASSGTQTTVVSGLSEPSGVAVDSAGDVFVADTFNSRVVEVTKAGTQTTVGSELDFPQGVAVDAAGDVFIADTANNRIVEVSKTARRPPSGPVYCGPRAWRWTLRATSSSPIPAITGWLR